ncbi:MAG: YbbR-like domain-containing protein [Blastocatellia bacterium]|nr:YbbR-like domain-containing protein [Blastocatellia bacterium]
MRSRLSTLTQLLRHSRIENVGLKILALLLALLLFAVSRQPKAQVRLSGVPLEFQNISPGLEVSGDVAQSVSVRLSGPRDVVRNLSPNQLLVIANLSNKDSGERNVQLRPDADSLPDNVEVLQIVPPSIRLKLEKTMKRFVTIVPQFEGDVPEKLEVYRKIVEPPIIEIEGPKSQVERLNEVMTETVNLAGRTNSFKTSLDVETPQNSIRVNTPGPIILTIEIGERRVTRHYTNIPVQWINQPAGTRPQYKTIELDLYGPQSVFKELKTADIKVTLDAATAQSDMENIQPQVNLPDNLKKIIRIKSWTKEMRK